jgi:hypothetical protein
MMGLYRKVRGGYRAGSWFSSKSRPNQKGKDSGGVWGGYSYLLVNTEVPLYLVNTSAKSL